MFTIGDTIIYRNSGICKITGTQEITVGNETSSYYVMKPVIGNNSTYYIPIDDEKNDEKIRHILSIEEVHTLIRAVPDEKTIWIENKIERKELYKQILAGNDCSSIMKLIKTLYLRQQELKKNGKKLHIFDERFMKDAEKALYNEFAHVLKIKREQVLPFISEQIGADEKSPGRTDEIV
jgi:CarD family transcriptional regulator